MAKEQAVTLLGSTKEQIFKNAYDRGLLNKFQIDSEPQTAYKITERYFEMETTLFDIYCEGFTKNLSEAGKIYTDAILDATCKVNMFSKNRLTARIEKLKQN